MEDKAIKNNAYDNLVLSLKAGQIEKLYIFHGEERYLLEHCLANLRTLICPDGLDSFNYKRFDAKTITLESFEDAVNTLPVFAERTLIEIHDFDIFKNENIRQQLCGTFADLPDYVCIVFVYTVIEYKPDGRLKANKELLSCATVVEFAVQQQDKLLKWIQRHFLDAGKSISTGDAEYLAFITGGLMTSLNGEIEKTAAYSKNEKITREDIDAVVIPVLDAVSYKLTDAIVSRDKKKALHLLDELFQMREAAHKLMFSISLKMRQLLAARVCIESNLSSSVLMEISGVRHEFQARTLIGTARKSTLPACRNAVLFCSTAALELNSSSDPESCILELVCRLSEN